MELIFSQIASLRAFKSTGFQRYLKNTFWIFLDKVLSLVIAFFVGLYVARYMGPKDYGLFNFAKSIAIFFSTFAALGLESIIVRNLIYKAQQREELLATAFYLRLIAGFFSTALVILIWLLFPSTSNFMPLVLIFVSASCFQAFMVIGYLYESRVESKFIVYITIAQTIITSTLKVYLVYINASIIWFVSVVSLEGVLTAVGMVILYKIKDGNFSQWKFNKQISLELLKDAWPLILSGFIILIYMKTDQIMIMSMLNESAVGHYAAASRLTEIWYFVGTVISTSLFPAIVNSKKNDEKLYHSRIQSLFNLMMILALIIALPVSFFSSTIVVMLYGESFLPASQVLQVQVWSLIFIYLGIASSRWLLAENLQKTLMYFTIMGAIANVGLNFLLIPKMGIYGAAIATVVAQGVSSYIGYAFSTHTKKAFLMQTKAIFLFNSYHFLKEILSKKTTSK